MTELVLNGGGRASIENLDGDRVVLFSTNSAPPGAMLQAKHPDGHASYQIKVRACRRDAERATFRIEGRFVNLPRTERERLAKG